MSDKSVSVTETMDGVKDENADVATVATNPAAATGDDVPTATVNDDRTKTQANENESTDDREPDVAAEETGVKVIEGNDSATDDDKLTAAMASTTISPSDESKPKDSDQNPSESVSDGQPQTQAPPVTAPKNAEVDETKANDLKECPKFEMDEGANSTSQFEDAREYVEDKDDGDHGEQERPRNDDEVNHQDNVPDGESGGEELLNKEEAEENGDGEEPTVASVPVPVDDDTNDPQYILRRRRFYEHDERMAYSTTSSEGSESEDEYDYSGKDDEEGSGDHRIRRRRTGGRKCKSTTEVYTTETIDTTVENSKMPSKRVLAISKVDAAVKNPAENPKLETSESAKKPGSRNSRDIDSLSKWDHDMYDEREQTRITRDELLASYGYDIREESETPRARRHHKYGLAATAKYTRNWQDTKAYSGASVQQSSKVRRGGMAQLSAGPSKNKSKSDEYSAEFPALDGSKLSKSTAVENPSVVENSSQKQQQISLPVHEQERNTIVTTSTTGPSQRKEPPPKTSTKYVNSPTNRHHYQDQQNDGSPSSSFHNKNYFNRNSADSNDGKEKNIPFNKDYSSPATNSNFFKRKPPPQHNNGNINQHQNYKQHHYNNQGAKRYNQHNQHTPSVPRGEEKNIPFNKDNSSPATNSNFFKRKPPPQHNNGNINQHQNYNQYHNNNQGAQGYNQHNQHTPSAPRGEEKNIPFNKDNSSPATNSNFFNRRPPPQYNKGNINQHQNYKQHHNNNQGAQGYNQHNQHTPSAPRGEEKNIPFNKDNSLPATNYNFFKRKPPPQHNNGNINQHQNYNQHHNNNQRAQGYNQHNQHTPSAPRGEEKNIPFNKDNSSPATNSNFFNRRPPPQYNKGNINQHQNYKQHHNNNQGAQGYNQHNQHTPSAPRGEEKNIPFDKDNSSPATNSNFFNLNQQGTQKTTISPTPPPTAASIN